MGRIALVAEKGKFTPGELPAPVPGRGTIGGLSGDYRGTIGGLSGDYRGTGQEERSIRPYGKFTNFLLQVLFTA
jgi:hypothetical protein